MSVIRDHRLLVERDVSSEDADESVFETIVPELRADLRTRSVRRQNPQTLLWYSERVTVAKVDSGTPIRLGDRWTDLNDGATYLVAEEPIRDQSRLRHAPLEVELRRA